MKNKLFIFFVFISALAQAEKENFIDNDWAKARAQAAKEHKYLFVDCYTDWCGWCKVMDKETFPDPQVTAFIQQHFVALKMEMEHNFGIQVGMKYLVTGYPTYMVFTEDGKLVYTIVGYLPVKNFLDKLNEAIDPSKQISYPGISDKVELDFPEFYKKTFGAEGSRTIVDSLDLLHYLDKQSDLTNEVNRCVIEHFFDKLSPKYRNYFLDNHEKYARLYGNDEVFSILSGVAHEKLQKAIDEKSEQGLTNTIAYAKSFNPQFDSAGEEFYKMSYYMGVSDWKKFAPLMDHYISKVGPDGVYDMNYWCWSIYEKAGDPFIINKAIGWMKTGIGMKADDYAVMDTYAALLYKGKRLDEAEKYALQAIELGKKSGSNVKSTEQLLEKIKAGKKGAGN